MEQRTTWADWVRVISSFLVVVHTSATLMPRFGAILPADWWAANVFDSIARICVPLFLMLTGALLLGRDEPLEVYFKKRIAKVALPLLAWSLIYIVWSTYLGGDGMKLRNLERILIKPAYFHLWYFYALIGLYLFVPFLRIMVAHASQRLLYYFVGLWFLAVVVLPQIAYYSDRDIQWDFRFIGGFVGYLVLGYLLSKWQPGKKSLIVVALAS